jgi:hypothetical protein
VVSQVVQTKRDPRHSWVMMSAGVAECRARNGCIMKMKPPKASRYPPLCRSFTSRVRYPMARCIHAGVLPHSSCCGFDSEGLSVFGALFFRGFPGVTGLRHMRETRKWFRRGLQYYYYYYYYDKSISKFLQYYEIIPSTDASAAENQSPRSLHFVPLVYSACCSS